MICIGDASSGKSKLLNDMLGLEFEVVNEHSAFIFHDSVDAIFTSNDIPIGYNVYDFQGAFAN